MGAREASAGRVVSYMDRRYVAFAIASLQPSFAPRPISPEFSAARGDGCDDPGNIVTDKAEARDP